MSTSRRSPSSSCRRGYHRGRRDLLPKNTAGKNEGCPQAPKTACPSPADYLACFGPEGDHYVVTLSGKLSGSYNAAMQARAIYREEGGRGNVQLFDSRSASAGQAQIALLIRELASRKLPFAQVVEQVEAYISRMQTTFVLENLDNLAKNGRLTRVQSLVTGALRVKLLMGGTREGEIEKLGQGLSIRQTLARMVSRMAENKDHVGRRSSSPTATARSGRSMCANWPGAVPVRRDPSGGHGGDRHRVCQ